MKGGGDIYVHENMAKKSEMTLTPLIRYSLIN
jgi:hypothetical protein